MFSPEAIERAAFLLWRKTLPALPVAKQQQTWVWLPMAAKRQWIEQARELATELERG